MQKNDKTNDEKGTTDQENGVKDQQFNDTISPEAAYADMPKN